MEKSKARERLRTLREEFTATVDAIRTRLTDSQRESGGDISLADQHPADVATETADRELDTSRGAMFEARIRQIDDALERLEAGTYGTCLVCGQPIPDERLEAIPDTPYCVKDAEKEQARAS
ncbi:MAG TPA: TraR/DksA C4-type zinc finger protein [Candidatus Limnocylindria bacterium]|nr:TraR/DksA C4-type zinc finger protein [Candidatus Limnocylindria bacterium]